MKKYIFYNLFQIVVSAFLVLLVSTAYCKAPLPEIKVNDVGGHIRFIPGEETLNVTLWLDTAGKTDKADWFLAAGTPQGFFFGTLQGWTNTVSPYIQTTLKPLPQTSLMNFPASALPSGKYTLYFAVDTDMDGKITWDQLYVDAVEVTILDKNLPSDSRLVKAEAGGTLNVTNTQGDKITLIIPPVHVELS